jgi:hypothetical protein
MNVEGQSKITEKVGITIEVRVLEYAVQEFGSSLQSS